MVDIYFDGGTDGMQVCVVIDFPKSPMTFTKHLGIKKTNNELEYEALTYALAVAPTYIASKDEALVFVGDSEVIIKHMKEEYSVRAPNLLPLYRFAQDLVTKWASKGYTIYFRWIPREFNKAGRQIEANQKIAKKMVTKTDLVVDYKRLLIGRIQWHVDDLKLAESSETFAKVICMELIQIYQCKELTDDEKRIIFRGMLDQGIREVCKSKGIVLT